MDKLKKGSIEALEGTISGIVIAAIIKAFAKVPEAKYFILALLILRKLKLQRRQSLAVIA
jgi:hypothetical protein